MDKQTNCWISISEANIPPIAQKGFRENVIIRKPVKPIVVKRPEESVVEMIDEHGKEDYVNHREEIYKGDDATVVICRGEYDGEAPTVYINREPVVEAYLKRMKNGEIIKVEKENFIIGKSISADYVIKDNPTISRQHVSIVKKADGYYLEDLKSANHTYINGEEIKEAVKLEDGTEFQLAEETFVFSIIIEK